MHFLCTLYLRSTVVCSILQPLINLIMIDSFNCSRYLNITKYLLRIYSLDKLSIPPVPVHRKGRETLIAVGVITACVMCVYEQCLDTLAWAHLVGSYVELEVAILRPYLVLDVGPSLICAHLHTQEWDPIKNI